MVRYGTSQEWMEIEWPKATDSVPNFDPLLLARGYCGAGYAGAHGQGDALLTLWRLRVSFPRHRKHPVRRRRSRGGSKVSCALIQKLSERIAQRMPACRVWR